MTLIRSMLSLAAIFLFLFLFAADAQAFGRRCKSSSCGVAQTTYRAAPGSNSQVLCSTCPSTSTCLDGKCATSCENGRCQPASVQAVAPTTMIQVCENGKCRMVPSNDPFVLPKSSAQIIVVYKH